VLDANWAADADGVSDFAWTVLFQGFRQDQVTGNYHARNRDYSPTLGRWVTTDPLMFQAGDNNLYRFVGNDPIGRLDPLGLADIEVIWRAIYELNLARGESARTAAAMADSGSRGVLNVEQTQPGFSDRFVEQTNRMTQAIRDAQWRARLFKFRMLCGAALVYGLVELANQGDPTPPIPGAKLKGTVRQLDTTVETWELPDGSLLIVNVDVNGKRTVPGAKGSFGPNGDLQPKPDR
jgi:RHS repeat-associated protein